MIARLTGIVHKEHPGSVILDVRDVGYALSMPLPDWDSLSNGTTATVQVTTYVREDRITLYGFSNRETKLLFDAFIDLSGVGPRMGLELCAVPRSLLAGAIHAKDASLLTSIKGVGRKSAEKLLMELTNLLEREPHILAHADGETPHSYDRDAADALTQLGFDTADVLRILHALPPEVTTTEERVALALRSL